jgi:ribosomal-protein-alanine N-acetyltransferase
MSASALPDPAPAGRRQTIRLRLDAPAPADLDDLVGLWQDPAVTATLGGPRPPDVVRGLLEAITSHRAAHGWGWWILRDPATAAFLGYGGIRHAMFDGQPEIELGYALLQPAWGRGLATELAREAIRLAFEELRLDSVVAITTPANRASQRVMEKAGMRHDKNVLHAGEQHLLYRITAAEWPGSRP